MYSTDCRNDKGSSFVVSVANKSEHHNKILWNLKLISAGTVCLHQYKNIN